MKNMIGFRGKNISPYAAHIFCAVVLSLTTHLTKAIADTENWYDSHRLQFHVRFSPESNSEEDIESLYQFNKDTNISLMTRHFKSTHLRMDETLSPDHTFVSYPTAPDSQRKYIAYYWHMGNDLFAGDYPNWICKSKAGKIQIHRKRGPILDITSDYKYHVLADMKKLLDMGAVGIYLDSLHTPRTGCYSHFSQSNAKENNVTNSRDNQHERVGEVIEFWATETQKIHKDAKLIVSTARVPFLDSTHIRLDQFPANVVLKTEFDMFERAFRRNTALQEFGTVFSGSIYRSFILKILTGHSGMPPHVWTKWSPTIEEAAAELIVQGAVANIDLPDRDVRKSKKEFIQQVSNLNSKYEQLTAELTGYKPIEYVNISFNMYDQKTLPLTMQIYTYFSRRAIPVKIIHQHILNKTEVKKSGRHVHATNRQDLTKPRYSIEVRQNPNGQASYTLEGTDGQFYAVNDLEFVVESFRKATGIEILSPESKVMYQLSQRDNSYLMGIWSEFNWSSSASHPKFRLPKGATVTELLSDSELLCSEPDDICSLPKSNMRYALVKITK